MVGGAARLKNMSPEQIVDFVSGQMESNPSFLANLEYNMSKGNTGRVNALTGQPLGYSSPYGFMPKAGTNMAPITVNVNAPMMTPQVMKQIEEAIARSVRTSREKGGTPPVIPGGGVR
jgi:hypothetical protein